MTNEAIPVILNRKIKATEYPSLPEEALGALLRFYDVETTLELIDAQHSHIVKLQQKLQRLQPLVEPVKFVRQ